tara:strand:- start:380 stop:637 length:258 start_codon:yes stop_codon:yes gene_type:complete
MTKMITYRLMKADDPEFEDDELECVEDSRYYIQIGQDGVYAVNRIMQDSNGEIVGALHLGVFQNLADAKQCLEAIVKTQEAACNF